MDTPKAQVVGSRVAVLFSGAWPDASVTDGHLVCKSARGSCLALDTAPGAQTALAPCPAYRLDRIAAQIANIRPLAGLLALALFQKLI